MSVEEAPVSRALQTKKRDQRSYLRTTSDKGRATQGNTRPSAFSSRVNPGHSISYAIDPLSSRQRQVRQVPLRHEERIGARARNPAFSKDSSDRAENACPSGRSVT